MSPAEAAIREALAAGPTDGPWVVYPETDGTEICAVDMAPGLPVRQMVARPHLQGKWIANASLIAACNPTAIRSLLSELDALRANAADGPYYKQLYAEAEAENAALRARCEAGEALLQESRKRLAIITGYTSKAARDTHNKHVNAIDAHLKGAGRE